MRLVGKLLRKLLTFVIMVGLLGAGMRFARPCLMKSAGLPDSAPGPGGIGAVHFSSDESDLMKTVFTDAIRLLTGQASRKELAADLSQKLYGNRADPATMHELGIELVQPGASPTNPAAGAPGMVPTDATRGPNAKVVQAAVSGSPQPVAGANASGVNDVVAAKGASPVLIALWQKSVANPELALMPLVCTGMVGVGWRRRRKRSLEDSLAFMPDMSKLIPSDYEPYTMTHAVHGLKAEDFELLVALVYQRQGYRVSMAAGLSGGRGGDFFLTKKNERLLVQCKNTRQDFKVPVERIRELHEAVVAAGATGGVYVASCGYTWDARNFSKTNKVTAVNARTLDQLVTAAHDQQDEDILAVAKWAPGFMAKVKLTPPTCPTCEAAMDQLRVSAGTVWVCRDRPECKGRRIGRSYIKDTLAASVRAKAVTITKKIASRVTTPAAPVPAKDAAPRKTLAAFHARAEAVLAAKGHPRVAPVEPPAVKTVVQTTPATLPTVVSASTDAASPSDAASANEPPVDAPAAESIIPYVTRRILAKLIRVEPRPGMSTISRPQGYPM